MFSPGVLETATGTLITSVHVEPQQRPLLVDLVRQFPEVTIIDIEALLAQVRDVMNKASLAVQYVFLFTLAAGLMVLLAAVQATRDERRYESAMLRTLGASRSVVFQGVAAEFIVLGALAGLLAAAGATGVGYLLATPRVRPAVRPRPVGVARRCRGRRRAGGHRRASSRLARWFRIRRCRRCAPRSSVAARPQRGSVTFNRTQPTSTRSPRHV